MHQDCEAADADVCPGFERFAWERDAEPHGAMAMLATRHLAVAAKKCRPTGRTGRRMVLYYVTTPDGPAPLRPKILFGLFGSEAGPERKAGVGGPPLTLTLVAALSPYALVGFESVPVSSRESGSTGRRVLSYDSRESDWAGHSRESWPRSAEGRDSEWQRDSAVPATSDGPSMWH
jgi:hypothetical protein